nr:MAG TPA: hypothetical protein [Caudoviricetes sp.]
MFTICLYFGHTLFTTDRYNVLKDKGKGCSKRVLKVYSMKQYIKLNSETFEVKKLKYEPEYLDYKTLDDCYANPSKIKRVIYNDWLEWLDELNLDNPTEYEFGHLTVLSYNINMFTLGVEVYNKLGELIGQLYITKTRQEFWTV